MNKYNRLVAKLYAAAVIPENLSNEPVQIDTERMSIVLEDLFIEEGLIEEEEE